MFENIIAQDAALQLTEDIRSRRLAPSMLFFGPPASGKGSAALELARVLSCEGDTSWNCGCPACGRHRYLIHSDLLILGPRPFGAEIAAAKAAFLREPAAARALFIRSLRKLLARFSPVLVEDDPKAGKLGGGELRSLLQSLEEDMDELEALTTAGAGGGAEKLCDSILKSAFKLEDEGMGDGIPVGHIRRAAYWARLAPNGRRKILLIENVDRIKKEEAKNSLLKILEEPPETVSIVLTAARREAIMPTLLSRLRPYRFLKRDGEREREVIRRVFRDSADGPISAYLDSFLPRSAEKLYPLAAFFVASIARAAAVSLKHKGSEIPAELTALGTHCGPIAEAAGFGKVLSTREVIAAILAGSGNFEARSFPRFLSLVLDLVAQIQKGGSANPHFIAHNDIWRKYAAGAEAAAEVWNQSPALALEAFFCRMKESLAAP